MDIIYSRSNPKKTLLLLVYIFFFFSACNKEPSPLPTQTPTNTNTITPTVTAVLTPTMTPTKLYPEWPVVFIETFDDAHRNWIFDTYNSDYCNGYFSLVDGRYLVNITAKKGVVLTLSTFSKLLRSFDVSVEVDKSLGSYNSGYGLILRKTEKFMYYFEIFEETQQYQFSVVIDDKWKKIIERTTTPFIIPQMTNYIRAMVNGRIFTFFINGKIVNQIEDTTNAAGQVGIGISLQKSNDRMLIAFDNFEVREPNP
jgi:hypothetical protein